jgi:colanic acid biosynthesis glycosyl transferase WcaI
VARVLILTLVFPPDSVSTAEIMGDLAVDLHRRGHDVAVVTTTPHYNRDPAAEARQPMQRLWGSLLRRSDYHGIAVYHVAMPEKGRSVLKRLAAWAGFHVVSTIAGLWLTERPDVIVAPSPPLSIGASAWIIAATRRARYVYNVQEIYPDIAINLGALKNPLAIRLLESLERFVYRKAAAVTVIAPRMRQRLVEKGVPAAKVHVIPNFVEMERLRPAPRKNEFSTRHALDGVLSITYAGNMGPAQGLGVAIEAARLLPPDAHVRILLIGEGIERGELTRLASTVGGDKVAVIPYQPNALMPQIYGASDVCLVTQAPSTGSDAIPSKVYRIMASGRPLIAVTEERSDLAAVVRDAACGVIVPPGDPAALARAITRAVVDRDEWRRMGERGRAHVEAHYARPIVAAAYDDLIRRVLPAYRSP